MKRHIISLSSILKNFTFAFFNQIQTNLGILIFLNHSIQQTRLHFSPFLLQYPPFRRIEIIESRRRKKERKVYKVHPRLLDDKRKRERERKGEGGRQRVPVLPLVVSYHWRGVQSLTPGGAVLAVTRECD